MIAKRKSKKNTVDVITVKVVLTTDETAITNRKILKTNSLLKKVRVLFVVVFRNRVP